MSLEDEALAITALARGIADLALRSSSRSFVISHIGESASGGSGFIGSNLVRLLIKEKGASVINLDKLTYAGNSESLADLEGNPNYTFEQMDLASPAAVGEKVGKCKGENGQKSLSDLFQRHQPDAVMHLAAESQSTLSIICLPCYVSY